MADVVYWVQDDGDPRNAGPRDYRGTTVLRPGRPVTPTQVSVLQPAAAAPVYASPPATAPYGTVFAAPPQYATPPMMPPMPPWGYPGGPGGYGFGNSYWRGGGRGWGSGGWDPNWGWGPPGSLGGLFGNLNLGTLIDAGTQIVAAFMALPTPPAPTSDGGTDVANLVTYQSALASHGKRDEQIRTVGNLASKLLG